MKHPTKWEPGDEVIYDNRRGVVVKAFGSVSIKIKGEEIFWIPYDKMKEPFLIPYKRSWYDYIRSWFN